MYAVAGPLKYVTLAPSQLGVVALPYAGRMGIATTPVAPADVIGVSGAVAAVNGPFFDTANGDSASYDSTPYEILLARHFDVSRGVDVPGSHPNDGSTISIVNGDPVVLSGSQVAPGATVAIQGWPTLVASGSNTALDDSSTAARAALAILSDGQLALVVSSALSMSAFADALVALGAVDAINLDGGGSASLVTQEAKTGGTRRVASWLVVNPPSGSSFLGALALGFALVVGGYFLWGRS